MEHLGYFGWAVAGILYCCWCVNNSGVWTWPGKFISACAVISGAIFILIAMTQVALHLLGGLG